jgi:hypothetical protein
VTTFINFLVQKKLVPEKKDFFLDRDFQESQGRLPEKGE